jgi:hypothetical protein
MAVEGAVGLVRERVQQRLLGWTAEQLDSSTIFRI